MKKIMAAPQWNVQNGGLLGPENLATLATWTYCLAPTSLTPEVSSIWLTFCTSRNCCIPRHPPSRPNTMNTRHVTWVAVNASSAWTFLDHLGRDGWCGKKLFSFPGRQRECYTHQTTMKIVLIWHLPKFQAQVSSKLKLLLASQQVLVLLNHHS